MDTIPIRQRVSCTVRDAAQVTGISRTRIYELLADGTLAGTVVGGRRLVFVRSLLRLLGEDRDADGDVAA
jgi:excisionase family DNA binding protein